MWEKHHFFERRPGTQITLMTESIPLILLLAIVFAFWHVFVTFCVLFTPLKAFEVHWLASWLTMNFNFHMWHAQLVFSPLLYLPWEPSDGWGHSWSAQNSSHCPGDTNSFSHGAAFRTHCIKTDKTLSNQQQRLRELKYHTGTVKILLVLCYLVQQHLKKLLLTELWHTDLPKNPNRLRECLKTQLDRSQAE